MDLDQLKEMWGSAGNQPVSSTNEEVLRILHKKSKGPIARMKRNLFTELIAVLVIYVLTITVYFIDYSGGMLASAWFLIVVGLLYILYYVRKRKLLNQMECVSCEVKSNLKMQLVTLEKYVRFYLLAGTWLFPVTLFVTGIVFFFFSPQIASDAALKTGPVMWLVLGSLLVLSAVLTVPVYFMNKWYVRKLYGQHIEKLKLIVNEMNED